MTEPIKKPDLKPENKPKESIPWGYRGVEEDEIFLQPETRHDPIPFEASPTGGPYRNKDGQWVKGCGGGPGQGHISALRAALSRTITTEDIEAVMAALIKKCKEGDVPAIKLLFDRLFGKLPANLKIDERQSIAVGLANLQTEDLRQLFGLLANAQQRPTIEAKVK